MRILLADDQPKIRFGLRLLFRRKPNLEIVGEAIDSETLRHQLVTLQPEILLLDWELPGLDPADLQLDNLRAASPGLKVIALSGRLAARQAALAAGADAFVSKGSPPEQLLATLQAICKENNNGSLVDSNESG